MLQLWAQVKERIVLIGAGLVVLVCLWGALSCWWDNRDLRKQLSASQREVLAQKVENAELRQVLKEQESHVRSWMEAAQASEKLAKALDLVAREKAQQLRDVESRYRTLTPTPEPEDRARVLDPIILDLTKGWGAR